jgi:hypothetical protein
MRELHSWLRRYHPYCDRRDGLKEWSVLRSSVLMMGSVELTT